MSLKVLLVVLLLTVSCQHDYPQIPRNPKIFSYTSKFEQWCRLAKPDTQEHEWAVYYEDGNKFYECVADPNSKDFSLVLDKDLGMTSEYITTLIYKCKKWKK